MEYETEEQQLEAIKKWFQRHGNKLLMIAAIVLCGFSANYYWHHHKAVIGEQASEHYMALQLGLERDELETIEAKTAVLQTEFTDSIYATLSSFALAAHLAKDKQYDKAEKALHWVLDNTRDERMKALARFRLMRLLVAQDKLDDALAYYQQNKHDGYLTLAEELKGDILVKQNKIDEAKAAYLKAYQSAPEQDMHGLLLKLKLQELGVDNLNKEKGNL